MFGKKLSAVVVALFVVLGSSAAFAGAGGGGGPAPTIETLVAQLAAMQTQIAQTQTQMNLQRNRIGELEKQNAQLQTDVAYVYSDIVPAIDGQLDWLMMTGKAKGEQINWLASLVEENYNWIQQNNYKVALFWKWFPVIQSMDTKMSTVTENLSWALMKIEALDAFSIPLMSKNIDQLLADTGGMLNQWQQVNDTVEWAEPLMDRIFPMYGPNGIVDVEVYGSLSVTGKLITLKGAAINGETLLNGPVKWIEWTDDVTSVYHDVSDWFECNVYASQTGEDCVLK